MILCTTCIGQKPANEIRFIWKSNPNKGVCWECYRNKRKNYLKRPGIRERDLDRLLKLKEERYTLIGKIKDVPCMDCGERFPPECMDFDHRESENKRKNVSNMIDHKIEKLLEEVAKCDIVCANCHRIRTKSRKQN